MVRWLSIVGCMNQLHDQRSASLRWGPRLLRDLVNAPDLTTAAAHLACAGVPVFPCVPGGKRPLTVHGFQDASIDRGVVTAWWGRHPDANIGVPTGVLGGIDVVDVDVHEGGSGFASFNKARQAGFIEGWACLVRTPSGGLHAYFLRTGGRESRSWQLPGKHIDFRGDGGYIIVPPSRVSGADGVPRDYQLVAVAEHPQLYRMDADGLRAFLDPPRPMHAPADMPRMGARPEKLAAWVASRPEGGRNGGLFWAACRLVEEGHDLSSTTSLLGPAACTAGLPEREAMATIRSAHRIATKREPACSPVPTSPVEAVRL